MSTHEKNSILVVDDEDLNLKLLTGILRENYTVYTADNGPAAIKIAAEEIPDLILLDVLMPEMDGYEIRARLKENEKTQKIPVIFITGLDSKEDEEKGLAMGASDYISKPFSVGIVRLRVNNQIQIVNQIRTIEELSLIDQLTGIPNRRNLDDRLLMEWSRAFREHLPLSLMMIDIDKFKLFNDAYGHMVGDQVLRIVAGSFGHSLKRPGDFAARYGGEEFSILLPDSDINGAMIIAEKIRAGVEKLVIPCGDGRTTKVTISIGVHSLIPTPEDAIADVFVKADQALYTAKETGRNKVCRYETAENADTQTDRTKTHSPEKDKTDEKEKQTQLASKTFLHSGILESLNKIDSINTEAGMSHYQGMTDLYFETVYFFTQKIPENCEIMEKHLRTGNIKNFCISVHSMKSALAAVGATRLSAAAAILETASKDNEADYCLSEYPGFHQSLLALYDQLAPLFAESVTAVGSVTEQKTPYDAAYFHENIKKAIAFAEDFDSDKAIEAVNAALQCKFDGETSTQLKAALKALSEFNFDTAADSLKKISSS